MNQSIWDIKSRITEDAEKLSREVDLSKITTQVLINRGYNSANDIKGFLNPSLNNLPSLSY
jgi:hypothetical protein